MSHDPFDNLDTSVVDPDEDLPTPVEVTDMVWLMGTKRGRRIVWRLLEMAGCFRMSFTPNANQTAFNEGMRNIGLQLLALIHTHCPELYAPMMKEQQTPKDA